MVQFINIAASIITVLGITYLFHSLFRWYNRPRFLLGILPSKTESIEGCGKRSSFDEYYFNKDYLAHRIDKEEKLPELKKFKPSIRKMEINKSSKEISIPIIIQNIGKTEAERYKLVIFFSNPSVQTTDVQTETLSVDGFYSSEEKNISNGNLLNKLPGKLIREKYKELDLTGSYVSFIGSLAAQTFEVVFLKAKVPLDLKEFYVIFRLDCPTAYLKRAVYAQPIFLTKSE